MLPPVSTTTTLRSRKRSGNSTSAASPAAPAPSTTVFSISAARRDRVFDVLFRHDEQIVDECAHDLAGEDAHGRDRDAFRDRRSPVAARVRGRARAPCPCSPRPARRRCRSPVAGPWPRRRCPTRGRRRRPGRRSCRRSGTASRISRPTVPWPAMIVRVVERGDERRAGVGRPRECRRERTGEVGAREHHLGAVVPRCS